MASTFGLTRRFLSLLACLAALTLLVAACGEDDDAATDDTEDESEDVAADEGDEGDDEGDDGESADEAEDDAASEEETDFPQEDIELVNPFEGGNYEIQSRAFVEYYSEYLPNDVTVGVRNAPGAGGLLGYNEAWAAEADGYTIAVTSTHADALRYIENEEEADWHPLEWAWIGGWFQEIPAIGASPDMEVEGWEDFIQHGQDEEIVWGTPGAGSLNHGLEVLFSDMLDLNASYVHYGSTGEALTAMARGEINAYVAPNSSIAEWVEDGEADWVGILREGEDPLYSDVPTIDSLEALDDEQTELLVNATGAVRGLVAKQGVPEERLEILRESFYEAATDDEWIEFMEGEGIVPEAQRGEDVQQLIEDVYPQLEEIFVPMLQD